MNVLPIEGDHPTLIVLDGGPMDGTEIPGTDFDEVDIVMDDDQQHRFVRTSMTRQLSDGPPAQVFDSTGRFYGPR